MSFFRVFARLLPAAARRAASKGGTVAEQALGFAGRRAGATARAPARVARPDEFAGRFGRVSAPAGKASRAAFAGERLRAVGRVAPAVGAAGGIALLGLGAGEGLRNALTPRVDITRERYTGPQGALDPELAAALFPGGVEEGLAPRQGIGGLLGDTSTGSLLLVLGLAAVALVVLGGRR